MRRLVLFLLGLLAGMLTASAQTYVFAGDSITDGGWGMSGGRGIPAAERNQTDLNHIYGHSYMMLVASDWQSAYPALGLEFHNRGLSGDKLSGLIGRWDADVLSLNPDVLSILIGVNESSRDIDLQAWENDYRALLRHTKEALPQVRMVLCTPFLCPAGRFGSREDYPVRLTKVQAMAASVRRLAAEFDAVLVPFDELFEALLRDEPGPSPTWWNWDGIHPTAAGHRRMADLWERCVGEPGYRTAQHRPLSWGDQGNGTYINPILNGDWSDPDAIRVGNKYYMVASDFHFLGMQILESDDLVNWRIVTQVYDRFDLPGWDENKHYAGGSWAPAIRWHGGKFWIYFCTPDEGLFMTQAERPEGPWSPLHCVKAVAKWEDPCPFWDDDGNAYLGRSQHGAGPIIVHRMSADGRTLLDEGVTVYTGPVAEGTKWLKRDGWYYLSIPEGGVEGGWQTVLRSKSIYGPYEKKVVLEQGSTDINGPHQGAIVDTPDGQWWFLHFQRLGALGRVVHLQPMHWDEDGWPVIGVDLDRNGVGEPVRVWTKPFPDSPAGLPQTSDDFASATLGPQWQWNHNPVPEAWSLTERPGALTLHALRSEDFWTARNTLTQRVLGYESEVTAQLDFGPLSEDGRAGLACLGRGNCTLGVLCRDGRFLLYREDGQETMELAPLRDSKVWLRLHYDIPARTYRFSWSLDGKTFVEAGEPFFVDYGFWKGVRWGLYHYNMRHAAGTVSILDVRYDILR